MTPDLAIRIAGVLAIFAAVGHGFLGDKILVRQGNDAFTRVCFQFGSLSWLVGGILFLLIPTYFSGAERGILIYAFIPMYLFAAIVNAWFTKMKHLGWVMLLAVVLFAFIGR